MNTEDITAAIAASLVVALRNDVNAPRRQAALDATWTGALA